MDMSKRGEKEEEYLAIFHVESNPVILLLALSIAFELYSVHHYFLFNDELI